MAAVRVALAIVRLVFQSAVLALGQIWANKMRSVLTTLGIVIGIASVTGVIAVLTGLKAKVLADFETIGAKLMHVFPYWPETGPMRRAHWTRIVLLPEQFDGLLENCPSVECFTRMIGFGRGDTARFGDRVIEGVDVMGIEPSWHKVWNRAVTDGRQFSVVDDKERSQVCLITPDVRDRLRLDRECVGQSIIVGALSFRVVGVVEPPAQMEVFGGELGSKLEVLIPFRTAYAHGRWMHVFALAKSPSVADEARAEISFFLRQTRSIKPGEPDTFRIEVIARVIEVFNKIAAIITSVASGIVAISLVVGGIGIMNIMLVSVSERTREIGLRKAVGARPSAILLQFLVEAVMLCLVGGLIGLAGGELLTLAFSKGTKNLLEKAYIPGWAIVLSFGFSAAVGLFFGMFPAIKAARLDPIEALRHE